MKTSGFFLLVCSSDAVLVSIKKPIYMYIHATEAYIYYRQTVMAKINCKDKSFLVWHCEISFQVGMTENMGIKEKLFNPFYLINREGKFFYALKAQARQLNFKNCELDICVMNSSLSLLFAQYHTRV